MYNEKPIMFWLQMIAMFLVVIMALNVVQIVLLANVKHMVNEQSALIAAMETTPETEETTPSVEETESTEATEVAEETEPTAIVPEPTETIPPAQTQTPTPTTTANPSVNNGMSEREMLACVIYQEAGGDAACDECRRRVGDIVLNRMADPRFPDTMYGVLTGKSQYGRFHWTGVVWPGRASNPLEAHAVERAYRIADEILAGHHSDLYGNGYIWQAEFAQGSSGFWHCGHYFAK